MVRQDLVAGDFASRLLRLAAETAIALRESGDYSAEALSAYQQAVEASGIFRELRRCEEYMNETHGGV